MRRIVSTLFSSAIAGTFIVIGCGLKLLPDLHCALYEYVGDDPMEACGDVLDGNKFKFLISGDGKAMTKSQLCNMLEEKAYSIGLIEPELNPRLQCACIPLDKYKVDKPNALPAAPAVYAPPPQEAPPGEPPPNGDDVLDYFPEQCTASSSTACTTEEGDNECSKCGKDACCEEVTACAAQLACICYVDCRVNGGISAPCVAACLGAGDAPGAKAIDGIYSCAATDGDGRCGDVCGY